jgi:DNA invertase Pin-like site-specific DNA recombinase
MSTGLGLIESADDATLNAMPGAVIYIRVSTREQTENLSLPTQLRACEEYCRREGYQVLERFREEGESAKTADRPALQRLLTFCRANKGRVHFVVVFNLTRFAREKYDHFALRALLKGLGISLRSATEPIDDTSTGKLMEGVLAAFAQFDNDVRSERTRAGMKAALEIGRWTFLAPIGYLNAPRSFGVSLIEDPERAPLVRELFAEFATGRYTKQQLQARMSEHGLRTRKGMRLSSQALSDMLENRLYIGLLARCPRVQHPRNARGFRAAGQGVDLLRGSGRARWQGAGQRSAPAQPCGLPASRIRAVQCLRARIERELVEGTRAALRLLSLPARLPCRERVEGAPRGTVRPGARALPAHDRLHATPEGVGASRLAGTEGERGGRPRRG